MSKEISQEEAKNNFIDACHACARSWFNPESKLSERERVEGVVFSVLNLIDGMSSLPAFDLVLRPHDDDKKFNQNEGQDWYKDGMVINDVMLHELFVRGDDES